MPWRRCAPCSGHLRPGDGLGAAQEQKLTWFTRAATLARWISLENRSSPNPSRARARCHGCARHILAHTLPQTLSRCDLSLSSSRRHIDPAAIAWSQPRRACATPNTPVPSPCSSLDHASFCIVIFAASWTLGVRVQWLGVPKVPLTDLVYTRCHYCTVGLSVRAARCQHGKGKSSQILDLPCNFRITCIPCSLPGFSGENLFAPRAPGRAAAAGCAEADITQHTQRPPMPAYFA